MMEKKMLKRSLAVWMGMILLFTFIAPVALMEGEEAPAASAEEVVSDENIINEETSKLLDETEEMLDNVTVEESAAESSNEEVVEEPAADAASDDVTTPAEEPAVEETPVVEEPAVEESPVVEEPAVEETPVVEEPAVEETPVVEEPTVEEAPVVEEPAVEETPVVEEPAVEETPAVLEIMYLEVATDIRLTPDGMSEILVTVPAGTELSVYEYEGYWAKVSYTDAELGLVNGYVYCRPIDASNMSLEIFSSRRSVMTPGETVYLTSVLTGTEGYTVTYQWECDKGEGFFPIEGANSDTYSFTASVETLGYDWRLTVYIE